MYSFAKLCTVRSSMTKISTPAIAELTIAPDRDRLLMSKELLGRVPALEDAPIPTGPEDEAVSALVEQTVMLVLERYTDDPHSMDRMAVPCHIVGSLRSIETVPNVVTVSMRVDLADALLVLDDVVKSAVQNYAGV